MRITLHSRSLRFRTPFRVSSWTIATREIVLLRVTDPDSGISGYGEAAPLPAFGTETLGECLAVLESFAREYSNRGIDVESLVGEGRRICAGMRNTPTARCAVETASLDLLARSRGVSLAALLGADAAAAAIPVNSVVGGVTTVETLLHAEHALKNGFTWLKLKVGIGSPAEDVERVAAVRTLAGPRILLRLDANGAWDFATARETLLRMKASDIEYIEQPVKAIEDLAALRRLAVVPIAADESAQRAKDARRIIDDGAADILVLKPMTAGGPLAAQRIAEHAISAGIGVAFTSFLDSAVARHAVAQLCAAMPQLSRHHGIATGALFLDDTGSDNVSAGKFFLPDAPGIGIIPEIGGEHASA